MSFTLDALGLTRNPFDPAPLEPTETDMPLFVGRKDEIGNFKILLDSTPQGLYRVVIMGAYGVGKTSFVNRIFWEAGHHSKFRFATIKVIAKEDMTYLKFLLELMEQYVVILRTANLGSAETKTVEEIKLNLDYERQIGYEESSELAGTLGAVIASLAGKLGVKENEIRTPRPWNERSAIRDLDALMGICLKHYHGVVVGIDECDYMTSKVAREVLKKGREEVFQRRNFLFLFIGSLRLRTLLDEVGSPIREIIDRFIILEPFRFPEERNVLNELIDLRFKHVAKDKMTYKSPFESNAVELIFSLSYGVPRRIVRFLQISMDAGLSTSNTVNTNTVLNAIKELGRGHFVGLGLQQRDMVKMLARKEVLNDSDFAEVRKKFELSVEKEERIRGDLESQGLLNSVFVGKDVVYSLAPELRVYILYETKLAAPILQMEAAQRIRQTTFDEPDENVKRTNNKNANLLEGQGHIGLLLVEYDSMSKEERLSHCSKTAACMRDLSDDKLKKVMGDLDSIISRIKDGIDGSEAKRKISDIGSRMKEYTKSVFEPEKADRPTRILFRVPTEDREVSIELGDEEISYRSIVLYEAMMRQVFAAERRLGKKSLVVSLERNRLKSKRGFLSRIRDLF